MQYSTELQKLMVGYTINPMRCWLCYGKLQSHLVPKASPFLHGNGEGRVWSTEYTTAVPPHRMLHCKKNRIVLTELGYLSCN